MTVTLLHTVSLADGTVCREGTVLEVMRRYMTSGVDGRLFAGGDQ